MSRRPLSFAIVLSLMLSTVAVLVPSLAKPADAAPRTKYTVCHRTSAIKNPYRRITVAWSSVNPNNNGHDASSHEGRVFNVAAPTATHGQTPRDRFGTDGTDDGWGDIFFAENPQNGQSNSHNWFTTGTTPNIEGQAIFYNLDPEEAGDPSGINTLTGKQACRAMSVKEYIDSELEEDSSKPIAEIIDELDEMEAAEDILLLKSLNNGAGTFRSWYDKCKTTTCATPESLTSAIASAPLPSVTTVSPTNVTQSAATLNGTISPLGNSMKWYFEYSTTNDFRESNLSIVNAPVSPQGPSTSTGTVNVKTDISGIDTDANTYYYRTVGFIESGTGDAAVEIFYYGEVKQFNSNTPSVTTEPATTVTGTTATINGTGTSNGAVSTVTFIWGTSPTLTSGNTTVNAVPSSLGASASATPISADLTGLTPGTTYYFRAFLTNSNGDAEGAILEFTTPLPDNTSSNDSSSNSSSASNDDPLGRVIGTAWFDIDRDNRKDADEPLLPGVDVQLTPTGVTGQSAGTVRKKNYVVKTDSVGAFDFSQLPPGTYSIKSLLPGDFGIQESWDTSGNTDWQVTVTVVALQTSRGDFAAVAPGEATGSVDGGGGGTFDATWSGFDQTGGTNDDVTFTVKMNSDGNFTLVGLPTGKYSVKATSRTGRTLVSSNALRVTKSGATLTINGLTMKVKIVALLPATGIMNMFLPFGFATMLIPAGVAVTAATRRRRRS